MPATKDIERNTWTSQFYYDDWTGQKRKKKKRGFITKKEALEWEREFLNKQRNGPDMLFGSLVELYLKDMEHRLRMSTMKGKRCMIEQKILPYFKHRPLNEIKPTDIRKWQNKLINDPKGYSETYLRAVNNQLSAIFNYSVRYYDLKENPCRKAGSMGKNNADEMSFWTKEEYNKFIECIDRIQPKTAFEILYWTGMRIGELMALTMEDIDFTNGTIAINKSLQRIKKKDIITAPKTPKSNRVIPITPALCNNLREYTDKMYDMEPKSRLFSFSKQFLQYEMIKGCRKSGVEKIRLHDLRHSHASLLIELGFSPLLIAERLGHEKVETTLNTYSHLYPHKQSQIIDALQKLQIEPK